jgi:anti-sigma regulatory factor (Ser/Thr protein kinase)
MACGVPGGDDVQIKMVLFLPRDAASVPVSRQVLDRCLETLGVAPDTRNDIALALSEACANVILHAGPGDEYEVQASARNEQKGTTVHFEKALNWVPGATGEHLFSSDGA